LEDLFDVCVREPVILNVDTRTTGIEFWGAPQFLELGDDTFPCFAERMECVLKNEWSHLLQKRDYPATVKWFAACCAVLYISSGQNPRILGSAYKNPGVDVSRRGRNSKACFKAVTNYALLFKAARKPVAGGLGFIAETRMGRRFRRDQ
jgi:hypothetical protein